MKLSSDARTRRWLGLWALLAAAAVGAACGIDLAGTGAGAGPPPEGGTPLPSATGTPTTTGTGAADGGPDAEVLDPDASSDSEAPIFDGGADAPPGATSDWLDIPGDGAGFGTGWNTSWWSKGACLSGDALFADQLPSPTPPEPQARGIEGELRWPRTGHPWSSRGSAPQPGVDRDFCARFQAVLTLREGTYRVSYVKDDGVRMFVDGVRVVDDWTMSVLDDVVAKDVTVGPFSSGPHEVLVYFRDTGGGAVLSMGMTGPL